MEYLRTHWALTLLPKDNKASPSQAWCPSIPSVGCGGSRTGPPQDCPALAGCLWRASWLSEAGAGPVLASARTAAHTAPYRRRTCPPLEKTRDMMSHLRGYLGLQLNWSECCEWRLCKITQYKIPPHVQSSFVSIFLHSCIRGEVAVASVWLSLRRYHKQN